MGLMRWYWDYGNWDSMQRSQSGAPNDGFLTFFLSRVLSSRSVQIYSKPRYKSYIWSLILGRLVPFGNYKASVLKTLEAFESLSKARFFLVFFPLHFRIQKCLFYKIIYSLTGGGGDKKKMRSSRNLGNINFVKKIFHRKQSLGVGWLHLNLFWKIWNFNPAQILDSYTRLFTIWTLR